MEASETFDPAGVRGAHPSPFESGTREDLVSAAEDAGAAVEQLCRVATTFVEREAQDAPYRVLGVAAGIGFVLGGGLAWRMIGGFLNVASRIALTHALDGWIDAAVSKAAHARMAPSADPTGRRFDTD